MKAQLLTQGMVITEARSKKITVLERVQSCGWNKVHVRTTDGDLCYHVEANVVIIRGK